MPNAHLDVALYRDCPANYRVQTDGAIPRCLRSEGHPNSHVSLFENRAIFWDTAADGSIVDRGDGKPGSQDEPNETSGLAHRSVSGAEFTRGEPVRPGSGAPREAAKSGVSAAVNTLPIIRIMGNVTT